MSKKRRYQSSNTGGPAPASPPAPGAPVDAIDPSALEELESTDAPAGEDVEDADGPAADEGAPAAPEGVAPAAEELDAGSIDGDQADDAEPSTIDSDAGETDVPAAAEALPEAGKDELHVDLGGFEVGLAKESPFKMPEHLRGLSCAVNGCESRIEYAVDDRIALCSACAHECGAATQGANPRAAALDTWLAAKNGRRDAGSGLFIDGMADFLPSPPPDENRQGSSPYVSAEGCRLPTQDEYVAAGYRVENYQRFMVGMGAVYTPSNAPAPAVEAPPRGAVRIGHLRCRVLEHVVANGFYEELHGRDGWAPGDVGEFHSDVVASAPHCFERLDSGR